MKAKKIIIGVISLCCIGALIPASYTVKASNNENTSNDSFFVLDEDVGNIISDVNNFMYENKITGYVTPIENNTKVEIACDNENNLDKIAEYVEKQGLNKNLIKYTLDTTLSQQSDGIENKTPVTSEELDSLVNTSQKLDKFINDNGYSEKSAYSYLQWNEHSVWLFVKTQAIHDEAVKYIEENKIDSNLVDVIVSPEFDYKVPEGGAKNEGEVNKIVADEYLNIKKYLNDNKISAEISLVKKQELGTNYTGINIIADSKKSSDKITKYLNENNYYTDVVEISIKKSNYEPESPTATISENITINLSAADVNGDGAVDSADATKILIEYAESMIDVHKAIPTTHDVNGDGSVDSADATDILIYYANEMLKR